MGSFFGNIGNAIKKAVTDTGHAVGKVASNPLTKTLAAAALAASGAGLPLSAGIMAGIGGGGELLKPGGNIGGALKQGAVGAATGGLASKAGTLARAALSGGGLLRGSAPSGGISDASVGGDGSTPVEGGSSGILDYLKKAGLSVLGGGGGSSGSAGGDGGQGTSILDKLLLGGTVAAGAADEVQQHNLQNKATDYATGAYDAKAPLRAQALAKLANPTKPDLSAVSADPGNVYDRARRARMLAASATAPTTAGSPLRRIA